MPFTLTARDLANLDGVHPDLVRVVKRAAMLAPIRFRVTEGMRTIERQRKLVARGASTTMRSRHLTGHAVDIAPYIDYDKDGDIDVDDMYAWPLYHRLAPIIKEAARIERVPIKWGGDWKSFKDGPHWQLPWKKYPVKGTKPAPERLTEVEASATLATGATGVAAAIAPAAKLLNLVSDQQTELTSGDNIRAIVAGVLILGTVYYLWNKRR